MAEKTHWKKLLDYNYLGSHDLEPGEKREIEFIKVQHEKVHNPRTNSDEEKVVATLKDDKPFIMNSTNLKAMELVTGSPYIENWTGCKAVVFVDQVRAFGGIVDALRIDTKVKSPASNKTKNAQLDTLTEKHANWSKVTTFVESQKGKPFEGVMTSLGSKYKMSPAIKKKLQQIHEG